MTSKNDGYVKFDDLSERMKDVFKDHVNDYAIREDSPYYLKDSSWDIEEDEDGRQELVIIVECDAEELCAVKQRAEDDVDFDRIHVEMKDCIHLIGNVKEDMTEEDWAEMDEAFYRELGKSWEIAVEKESRRHLEMMEE